MNVTDFPQAINYGNTVATCEVGYSFLGPFMLLMFFLGFLVVSSRFASDRALLYSLFMSTIAAFLLASAAILDPIYVVYCVILLAAVVYFGGV